MEEIKKSFVERRGWPRTIIDKLIDEAKLQLPADHPQGTPQAEVVNLSEAGAGLLTPMQLTKGMQVKLEISGKDIPRLNLEAEVRWSSSSPVSDGKFPAGLKFHRLNEQGRMDLQNLINLMRKYRPPLE